MASDLPSVASDLPSDLPVHSTLTAKLLSHAVLLHATGTCQVHSPPSNCSPFAYISLPCCLASLKKFNFFPYYFCHCCG